MKNRIFYSIVSALLFATGLLAAPLYEERPYEPFVINGGELDAFTGIPVQEIFCYAYHQASETWEMIPFQIDERIRIRDPFPFGKPESLRMLRHFYINENTNVYGDYSFQDTLYMAQNPSGEWVTLFDIDDELVFMIGDMGDRAPERSWIDDAEAQQSDRLEIELTDPRNPQIAAYAYLYRSSTLRMPEAVADKYGLTFDPETQTAASNHYAMRLDSEDGLVRDMVIKPPFGAGVDIFDRQKMRFNGRFFIEGSPYNITFGDNENTPSAQENAFMLYDNDDYLSYTKNPVVRIVRECRYNILLRYDDLAFYVRTKFYPHSGTIEGGASLDPVELRQVFGIGLTVEFNYMRQSWDFNANASGMRFYNRNNPNGLLVDGVADSPDTTVDVPIEEWSLITGDPGALLSFTRFDETNWKSVSLYYHDSEEGGVADEAIVVGRRETTNSPEISDSGDLVSYGDHGISFFSLTPDSPVNLELDYTAYFLPAHTDPALAEKIVGWIENPVITASRLMTEVESRPDIGLPQQFELLPVYPNPFNPGTVVRFRLGRDRQVTARIFDVRGRLVRQLAEERFDAGVHELSWDGRDDRGRVVAGGLYVVRVATPDQQQTQKMVLLR
ncbi:T9SS type A sorting domain-containing protein [candidate division KSB1 bacterium]|nr:T9SS type A sorting domain-containing protein [candidate division KSB1 bacterium]